MAQSKLDKPGPEHALQIFVGGGGSPDRVGLRGEMIDLPVIIGQNTAVKKFKAKKSATDTVWTIKSGQDGARRNSIGQLEPALVEFLEQAFTSERLIGLIVDKESGTLFLNESTLPPIEGQDLSALAQSVTDISIPEFEDKPSDDYWTADKTARELNVAKSTITRQVKTNKVVGFKLFKNGLYIPKDQFDGGMVISGVENILAIFEFDHHEAWRFLSSSLFYGDKNPRPIDRLRNARTEAERADCLSELGSAKRGFEFGDFS
ncbi:hypothetical protein [Ahrensia sp. R2A130]|uniref:hypothetical protein n=1 Tax=Ahrensia sp. R2A130 TaxID=744979 RepID=UPI0012E9B0C2|nr:hypothetical protein [Ahrensia sp. R2A130]